MQWKLSFLIGTPLFVLTFLVGAVIIVIAWRKFDNDETDLKLIITGGTVGVALCILIPLFATTMFPLKAEYLQWRPVAGQVESIDKRLIGGEGGMSERYVVRVDGYDVPYSIDDTRAATLREGDDVSLMCTREWQWASNPGYACRWNQ